ncbi:MAG: transposase [Verrucomicrobiae bacterium]|nr:transposase [Verrucomicrobiae bacterium]
MARPLRCELEGGRQHVMARGNERRPIFVEDRDRQHFMELLAELPERFGVEVHAWVLMDNHYHLLLRTPEANLSRACQWLNVAYSVWFNRRHERIGHLFQGRFKSVLVDDGSWMEVARYVHLNPVRVAGLGLGKPDRARQRTVGSPDPGGDLVARRLEGLRSFRWSSYRAYAGLAEAPPWLTTGDVLGVGRGGLTVTEARRELRKYHEAPLRGGRLETVWDRVVGGALLGSEEFIVRMKERLKQVPGEVSGAGGFRDRIGWERIVEAVEAEHGERWEAFRDRHGDWARDVALYLGRRRGRMTLRELGERVGGLGVAATGQAVSRVTRSRERGGDLARRIEAIERQLSKSEM